MTIRLILAVLALAAAPSAALADGLHVRGDRLFIEVEIAGRPVEALLDSGAEMTVLDPAFAATLALDEGESVEARGTGASVMEARLVENLPLRVLGRVVDVPVAAVIDLSDVGARLIGGALPVVLGREAFDAGRMAIDIEGGTIGWQGTEEAPAGTRLALLSANGIETIPVRFGEVPVQADFDLGNGGGLLISQVLATRLGLEPVGIEPGGGLGGVKELAVVHVPELEIAGHVFRNVRAHVDPAAKVDANVGVAQLRAFRIVTDFAARAIWLEARGD